MTNRPFRPLDHERDIEAIQRIWIECGWIDDDKDEREVVSDFFKVGETEVATINGEAECSTHWSAGTVQYQDETLNLGAVTAVTTSHIARKQGFAKELTARSLARQFEVGMDVSALGIFDQGFYNKVGYGNGSYENLVQFDPTTLMVDAHFRPPVRLDAKHFEDMHHALSHRRMGHGEVVLTDPELVKTELGWTEKPFGLGYFDGPDGSLSHFIWGGMNGENGPYEITMRAYQNNDQLMELLALIKSLGDQINSFTIMEFCDFQLQDLLNQPFRTRRASKGSKHEQGFRALAYWQFRMLNLEACLAKTHLPGPGVRFNLTLSDPLQEILDESAPWRGLTGEYIVDMGPESNITHGNDKQLPTLTASINAFSRFWFGVRPASHIAVTDDFHGSPELVKQLDDAVRLPKPHFGWDF